jgi:ADP-ribosyl-[dinitrogen reductase] hydrolase
MFTTELPFGLPGRIFRSPMPYHYVADPEGEVYGEYEEAAVTVVAALVSDRECREQSGRDLLGLYASAGWEVLHYPVGDFAAPAVRALEGVVEAIASRARQGRNVAVHCSYGQGRAGTVMAALAKHAFGMDGPGAIEWVRQYLPGAVETEGQQRAVARAFGGW